MSKFKVVKEAPETLQKGEYLIDTPSFLPEIKMHESRAPRNGLVARHHLRSIISSIAQAYDPENMTTFSIKAHNYEGRPFASNEELNGIVVESLKADYPAVFQKYLDTKIRNRPTGTTMIYYVDSKISFQYETFYKNGLTDVADENKEKTKSKTKEDKATENQ